MPACGNMSRAAPGFGDHLARHQEPELDADAGKSDPLAALLRARRDVVIPGELLPLNPAAIGHDGQCGFGRARQQPDQGRARIERIGDDFGENLLLERAGVGVAQIFEEVLEVDAGLARGAILSLRSGMVPELRAGGPRRQ